jgi:hypothetical protein
MPSFLPQVTERAIKHLLSADCKPTRDGLAFVVEKAFYGL